MWFLIAFLASQAAPAPSQAALDETVAAYCAVWSDPDPARRRELANRVWAPGATYTDPQVHLDGADALLAYIVDFHKRFPGVKIVVTSQADYHHGALRFSWRMVNGSGGTVVEGMDYGELAPDGRIRKIVGFFGPFKPK